MWRWLLFWRSARRRTELRDEMKATAAAKRAVADSHRDYFLERDLAEMRKDEEPQKTKKG